MCVCKSKMTATIIFLYWQPMYQPNNTMKQQQDLLMGYVRISCALIVNFYFCRLPMVEENKIFIYHTLLVDPPLTKVFIFL
jgi:hypothetical protein